MSREIIIFGTGLKADEEVAYIIAKGYRIKYFVDNDEAKWGKDYKGSIIKSPDVILNEKERQIIVITSEKFKEEIISQLIDMGVYYKNDCIGLDDFEYKISAHDYICKQASQINNKNCDFSVLYDSQAFAMQKQGGVSRYYYEIIKRMVFKPVSVNLFMGVNGSVFDFGEFKDSFKNYYSVKNSIGNKQVKNALNAEMIRDFVGTHDCFGIYHPTYYNKYSVHNYKKMVVTVYDMIHELYDLDRLTSMKKKELIGHADGIIAISNCTKDDLINIYGISEDKIKVIYLANSLNQIVEDNAIIKDEYILFVGSRDGYKNGRLLMSAFAHCKLLKDYRLVFMGGGQFTKDEKCMLEKLRIEDRVTHFSGDDYVLANLYKNASCFVYPSSYEGFGLPILEAMHYGTPVITTNSSSLAEVAGDAALYFEKDSEENLIFAIERMIDDSEIRSKYRKRGIEREKIFSWDRCTEETFKYYYDLQET